MAKTTRLQKAREGKWAFWVFVVIPISIFALFVIWPTVHLIYLSLQSWKGMGAMKYVGLKNYAEIFTDEKFWIAVQHNAFWAVATVFGTTVAGLILALLLGRTKAWGRWVFQILLFLPQMVSSVVVSIIWRWIYFPQSGPLNVLLETLGLSSLQRNWLGDAKTALPALFIAYSWIAYGFSMLVFLAAIDSVDQELFDAARIDGANWFGEIWHILLPVIRPAVRTVFIMMGIWSFQVFDMVWLTTRGGPGYSTIVLALQIYRNTFVESRVGVGSALATILLVLVLILAIITRRGGNEEAENSI